MRSRRCTTIRSRMSSRRHRMTPRAHSKYSIVRRGADSTLSKYFREMAQHRVLTPKEEVEAAQEVERLEIGYWDALLAYPSAFETVAAVLERHVTEQPLAEIAVLRKLARAAKRGKLQPAQQSRWDKQTHGLATKLRVLDSDRVFVAEAYQAVHRLAGMYSAQRDIEGDEVRITAAFKRYLASVENSRRAQSDAKNRFVEGEPAARGVDRAPLQPRPPAADRPDPGGQHRPDEGGRALRSHARLPLLDLRVVVDPARDQPRARRQGPRGPHPRAHARHVQPRRARDAGDHRAHRPRADARASSRRRRASRARSSRR